MISNYINLANELIANKKFSEAKEILESNLLNDENVEAEKLLGLCCVNLKDTTAAIAAFEKAVEMQNDDATSWFYLANLYDSINAYEKAEKAYKRVVDLRGEYIDAYKNLTILYLKNGQHDKAKPLAKKSIELAPEDYQTHYIMGTIYITEKDFENAINSFEKAISYNQSNPAIYNSLGAAYFALNQLDDAEATFAKALALNDQNPVTHYHMGNIAQIKRNYNDAYKHFQISYANDPSTLHLTALAYSALKAERFDDAVSLYNTLIVIHPEKQNYQYNLACAYVRLKKYKDAINIMKKLVMMNPKSISMAEKLAEIYVTMGEYGDAKLVYELLIKKGKVQASTYYNYALICMKTKDFDNATKIFKKVLKLEPENATAHKDLGVIYLNQRLFDYAKEEFELALRYSPDDTNILFEFANYLYATADYKGAKVFYQKACDKETNNAQMLFYKGLNHLALNELEEAKEAFTASRNIEQNDINTYHLARVNFYLQNYSEAENLLNSLETLDIDAQNLMALTLYELGRYDEAKEIYLKILEKFHENINIMLSLAKCYIKTGEKDKALNAIEETLKRFPEHEEALKLKSEAEALE